MPEQCAFALIGTKNDLKDASSSAGGGNLDFSFVSPNNSKSKRIDKYERISCNS